jgi:predicted esterase
VGLHPELRVRLLHGDADGTIPLESSAVFEAVLAEAGYDVELVEFEGGHTVPPDLVIETVMELIP